LGRYSKNFYEDDVIVVTSVVLRTRSVGPVFCKCCSLTSQ